MNGNAIRVLLIEDNPGDARLIQEMLREASGVFDVQYAGQLSAGLEVLARDAIDVVLLDLGLPDTQGLETLVKTHQRFPQVPILVLTGLDAEEVAVQAVQTGAQDYLLKGQIESGPLARAIRYAIERKQIEEARVRAEEALHKTLAELEGRNQELESFTYSVSHDLKEPLRTLEAFSQFVLEDYAAQLDDQGRDYLMRMSKAAGRLKQMIDELLTLSRLARPPEELRPVDVGQVVSDIARAFSATLEEKDGRIDVAPGLPRVLGDLSRVEQIFGNLIANGLKFNRSQQPAVTVGLETVDGRAATFFVRDNGIGIDPQYHDKIFGVFQRLHRREEYDGTGAGLAIVQRAAEALGGQVWLDSTPGAGATFFVSLPLGQDAAVAA